MIIKKGFIIEKFKELPITFSLIIVNVVAFMLPILVPSWNEPIYQYGALNGYWVLSQGEWSRLLSSLFLHSGAMHIVMNMLSLYIVGRMIERLFRPSAYLGIYFISALFGSFLSMYVHPAGWAVGASGAIFGLFGALAGFAWVYRTSMKTQFMEFMRSFGMILVINFVIGMVFPSIDMSAHIGGLIAGFVGGFVVAKNPSHLWVYMGVGSVILLASYEYLSSLYAV